MSRQPIRHADHAAERAALGCAILDRECAIELCALVRAEDYHDDRHAIVHAALAALLASDGPIDTIGVSGHLAGAGALQRAGGDEYLIVLTDAIPNLQNVERYGRRIRELAAIRSAIEAARKVLAEAQEGIENPAEWLSRSENAIGRAVEARELAPEPVPVSTAINEVFQAVVDFTAGKGLGHKTGLTKIDKHLCGMQPGEMIVLAGRPGTGKTSLALRIAHGVEQSTKQPVYIQSIEMPRAQLGQRLLAMESGIKLQKMREASLSRDDVDDMKSAAMRFDNSLIVIDDTPRITLADFGRQLRRLKRKRGLSFAVLDYLQLMRANERKSSRELEVAEVSAGIKALAKELNIPILALASLNRESEKGAKDKRPTIAHLRESGSIESDADTVLLLYRDELVDADTQAKGIAELIIGKQRHGATGTIQLAFNSELTRFDNLEPWREAS